VAVTVTAITIALATAGYLAKGRRSVTVSPIAPTARTVFGAAPAVEDPEIRILAGYSGPRYLDSFGRTWLSDRFYSGGRVTSQPDRRIYRTQDPTIYRTARLGDFQYDIPLKPGLYQVHLHFAETIFGEANFESTGEGTRRFNIQMNGHTVLRSFDIIADAGGPNIADERVFKDVTPDADGFLHLKFLRTQNSPEVPLLNGIEILPGIPGKIRPIRILAGGRPYIDSMDLVWGPDRYFLGGMPIQRSESVKGTNDTRLYAGERWGHFSYAIPVPEGSYQLTLRFSERDFGPSNLSKGGVGSRFFDVFCNGVALLRNYDIYADAGGENRAVAKTFRGLKPNHQGKLVLSFVPGRNYACVNAIEVVDDKP